MRNRTITLLTAAFILFVSNAWGIDRIHLKSGEVVEGEIVHESSIFVRIKTGVISTEEYLLPHIDHIEYDQPSEKVETEEAAVPETMDESESMLDTIVLKTGESITGTITRQTSLFIAVQIEGKVGTEDVLIENIETVNGQPIEEIADLSQLVKAELQIDEVIEEYRDDVGKEIASITTDEGVSEDIKAEGGKIAPLQKVLSKDAPQPMRSSSDYRTTRYSGGSNMARSRAFDAGLAMQQRQMERMLEQPQVAIAQQQAMMSELTEVPSIFNPESFNRFLDQTLSGKSGEDASRESSILKRVMSARPGDSEKESSVAMDKLKILVEKIILGLLVGVALPVIAVFVLLLINIFRTKTDKGLNKEVYDELESIEKMKAENKVAKEEYDHLVLDAKSRLKQPPLKMFWNAFPRVFIYPFRPHVLLAAVAASVLFYVVRIAMYAPFYGFFATILAYVYLVACFVKIIETAVQQENEDTFDWPSFTEMVDWFGKGFLFLVGWLMCHVTAFIIFFNFIRFEPTRLFVVALSVALLLIGMFVYPMVILSMSLVGGMASLNIINVFKAINSTYVAYVLLLVLLFLTQVLSGLTHMIPLIGIPLFGDLFKWFLFVYFMLVDMRLIGIFYKTHRTVLQWYGEDE